MAKMTTQQKLDQARALVEKYTAELAAGSIRDNIEVGDVVTFSHGRADTKVTLTGTVKGVKDDTNGRWVAVGVGEGFDETNYRIRAAAILANPAGDARNAAATPEAAPADPLSSDPADPLAAAE